MGQIHFSHTKQVLMALNDCDVQFITNAPVANKVGFYTVLSFSYPRSVGTRNHRAGKSDLTITVLFFSPHLFLNISCNAVFLIPLSLGRNKKHVFRDTHRQLSSLQGSCFNDLS